MKTEAQVVRDCKAYLDILRCKRLLEYRSIHVIIPKRGQWVEMGRSRQMMGMADMEIYLRDGKMIHVEFKSSSGKQRATQKQWQEDLRDIGHSYYIVSSLEMLQAALKEHGIARYSWASGEIKCDD